MGSLLGHAQEVCGLRWSPEGTAAGGARYLASGANDNLLHVWEPTRNMTQPLHTFTQHQAAVKVRAVDDFVLGTWFYSDEAGRTLGSSKENFCYLS